MDSEFITWLLNDTIRGRGADHPLAFTRNKGNHQVALLGQMRAIMHHRPHQPEF